MNLNTPREILSRKSLITSFTKGLRSRLILEKCKLKKEKAIDSREGANIQKTLKNLKSDKNIILRQKRLKRKYL
jgi:hypothetical protein